MSFTFKGLNNNDFINEGPVCSRSGLLCGSDCLGCDNGGSGCINTCRDKCTGSGAGCDNQHCVILKDNSINNKSLMEGGMTGMENKEIKDNKTADESRREFLKGAGLIVGSTALLGAGGLAVSGCSVSGEFADGETCTTTTTRTTTVNNVEYLGECVCPDCGIRAPHPKGTPCRLVPCPKCGGGMGRFA